MKRIVSACPKQVALLKEQVILVDKQDMIIGHETKEQSHLNCNIEKGMLHRAFSVFLFNTDNKLLVQKRSDEKITFPSLYTNTCCSHPLYTIPAEQDGVQGVKVASVRRLKDELGITEVAVSDLHFMTRMLYYSPSNGQWGEYEMDYVLIARKDVQLDVNSNEISEVAYLSKSELYAKLSDPVFPRTPWFDLIASSLLSQWWDNLDNLDGLKNDDIVEMSNPPGY